MSVIYLDHNSTTPMLPEVRDAMLPFLSGDPGNPASAHAPGRRARQALEDARDRSAVLLGAHPDEVVFTSGATEANNLAILGHGSGSPGHVLSSPVEHPSVLEPLRHRTTLNDEVEFLPVTSLGIVTVESLAARLRPETHLVCVMLVNHETGSIQPVQALSRRLDGSAAFHCDATQAAGKMPLHFHDLGVTTLALSAHKFHGPVGIGALLVRRATRLQARTWGGHQQQGRRPGTEPVALIVGMAKALELAGAERENRCARVTRLRGGFLARLKALAAPIVVNGPIDDPGLGSPYTLNVSFPGCRSDALLMNLDLAGVACSTGSACSSGSLLPSPVLQAMNVPEDVLSSAMRFSFSYLLGADELDEAARRIGEIVARMRRIAAREGN